jgi:AFG3 family protein
MSLARLLLYRSPFKPSQLSLSRNFSIRTPTNINTPIFNQSLLQRSLIKRHNSSSSNQQDPNWETLKKFFNPKHNHFYVTIAAALGLGYLFSQVGGDNRQELTWQAFRTRCLDNDIVEKVEVLPNRKQVNVDIKGRPDSKYFFYINDVETFEKNMSEAQAKRDVRPEHQVPINYTKEEDTGKYSAIIINVLLVASMFLLISRASKLKSGGSQGLMDAIIKTPASLYNKESNVNVSFKDVAGLEEAKQEINEFVDFLKNPQKYEHLGAKIPKGALLVGPPGTGKTLLAKATAGEANVPFFSISGSDFMEMFVGVGPSRVRNLFAAAKKQSPSIIFIDEIDAIGRARSKTGHSYNDERENTLNALLVEMDGFVEKTNVIVLAGTNRVDVLDKALLRAGRFDRHIVIDKPDIKERFEIFQVHLKKLKLKDSLIDIAKQLASRTPGMAGAEIANVCNEGAIVAARHDKKEVELEDFEIAIDRVIVGLEKKNKVLSPEEKRTVAYHEAGHAIVGWMKQHTAPVIKVSIVPRGSGILGYVQNQPKDQYLYSKEMLFDQMCNLLGGRVSEKLFFGKMSTGAVDDLQKVTELAYSQIALYGMSEELGHVSFPRGEEDMEKPYSQATSRLIDRLVRKLIDEAHVSTENLIEKYRPQVELIAQQLLSKEILTQQDMVNLVGERPFPHKSPVQELEEAIIKQGNREKEENGKKTSESSAEKSEIDFDADVIVPA